MAKDDKYDAESIIRMTPPESVRKRPGMYFGCINERGLTHLFLELLSNAIDATIKEEKPEITVHSIYPEIIIEDNGPGFPFGEKGDEDSDKMHLYMTTPHNQRSRDDHAPHVHISYLFGVGLWAINAVSTKLNIKSWRNSKRWEMTCCKGKVIEHPKVIENGDSKGTIITVKIDEEIFNDSQLSSGKIRGSLFQTAHLFPGLKLNFEDETFISKNGLADFVHILYPLDRYSSHGFSKNPFIFNEKVDDFHVNLAIYGVAEKKQKTNWVSWVNGYETLYNGCHVKGVNNALRKVEWKPLIGMIHILHYNPQFAGPTKGKLEIPGISLKIKKAILPKLQKYTSQNKDYFY